MPGLNDYWRTAPNMQWVCDRGHPRSSENTSVQKNGKGQEFLMCRVCNRERAKAWRLRNADRLTRRGDSGSVLAR